jgi:hypothetical protein
MNKVWMALSVLGALISTWFHVAYEKLRKKTRRLEKERHKKEFDEKAQKVRADVSAHDIDDLIKRVDKRISDKE